MTVAVLPLAVGALALLSAFSTATERPPDELKKFVIAVDRPSTELAAVKKKVASDLTGVKPKAKAPPQSMVTQDGRFILFGDLFRTGTCFALFEISTAPSSENEPEDPPSTFALAEWNEMRWHLRGLWRIPIVWRAKGSKKQEGAEYFPVTPATRPFELRDFSGDRVPEVIVAGEVAKYYQAYYLLRFVPQTRGLDLLVTAMAKPELAGKYVRLYFDSGHKAIYTAWEYMEWFGEKLITKASWHDESPYNNVDPHFVRVEVTTDDGRMHTFLITDAGSDSEKESAYTVTQDEMPFAQVVVRWRKSVVTSPVRDYDEVEKAWFFERVTALPRRLFPWRDGVKDHARLEDHATVHVVGSDEARRKLSFARTD